MAITNQKTLHHGHVRSDGFIFWSYRTKSDGRFKEEWYSPEKFLSKKNKNRLHAENSNREAKGWSRKNPERLREVRREYYKRNAEKLRPLAREYKKKRTAHEKLRLAKWNKNNRGRRNASDAKRRAIIAKSFSDLENTERKIVEVFYETSERVSLCLGIRQHVDHIVPLAKGGLHHPSNLQILPWRVNLSKGCKVL